MVVKLKIRAAVAALVVVTFTTAVPVKADTLSDKLRQQQTILQQNKDTYDDIEEQIDAAEAEIQRQDEQIMDLFDEIDASKEKMASIKRDIDASEKEIEKKEEQLNSDQEKYGNRIKSIYINGTSGYLNVLLEAESFSDFISRIELITRIIEFDKKEIDILKAEKQELYDRIQELLNKKDSLATLQSENEKKIGELNSLKESQSHKVAQLKEKQNIYADRIDRYQAMVDSTLMQINGSGKSSSQNGQPVLASRGMSSTVASGSDVVEYAVKFLGVPYVYGGSTPSGFDCSGFTAYVYSHFGVSLNRRARDQAYQGTPVSFNQLQPGDLVFFGTPAYHVGIYVGNGMYIHAPQTGDVVKISTLKYMSISGARRVR